MQHVVGGVLTGFGLWLLLSTVRHLRSHVVAPAEGSLAVLADIMPPLVIMALGVGALEVVLAYAMVGRSHAFSLFDLVGVLFSMGSYGAWIVVKSRYRGARPPHASG